MVFELFFNQRQNITNSSTNSAYVQSTKQIIEYAKINVWAFFVLLYQGRLLTALVPTTLWSAGKNNGAAWRRVTDTPEEQKCSRMKQNNLLIEGFKSGAPCCLLVFKNDKAANCFLSLIFYHNNNNTVGEFGSGIIDHREIEGKLPYNIACLLLY
jgi:hypothetical protein